MQSPTKNLPKTDVSEILKLGQTAVTAKEVREVCPDLKVNSDGSIEGTVKGHKNVRALAEMFKKQHSVKHERAMKRAASEERVVLTDREGRTREVRARSAARIAKRRGMYEKPYYGRASLHMDASGNWWRRRGDKWVPLEAQ